MKPKVLLLMFALLAFALPAHAQLLVLDDPALTTGDPADRIVIVADATAATLTSRSFRSEGYESAVFKIIVSACPTSCNLSFAIDAQDSDGTWWEWDSQTAISAVTTGTRYYYGCVNSAAACTTTGMGAPPVLVARPMPPIFRVRVVWNSGTSWSGTVAGVLW